MTSQDDWYKYIHKELETIRGDQNENSEQLEKLLKGIQKTLEDILQQMQEQTELLSKIERAQP